MSRFDCMSKKAERMTDSVDPDQTAYFLSSLIWVFTVRSEYLNFHATYKDGTEINVKLRFHCEDM